MSKIKKVVLVLVCAVVAAFVVLLLGRNVIIKTSVPPAVRSITGFDVSLGEIDVGLFSSQITIKDLKVTNPDDFGEKRMLEAPEIHVEYKPLSMMSDRREFPRIRLNLAEVVVVKNEKGESNVKRIMEAKPKSEGPSAAYHIGQLDLTLGKVVYVDYSKMVNGKPLTRELTLNLHGTYHNLSDTEMKKVVFMETLKNLPIKLPDISPQDLQKDLQVVGRVGMGVATNAAGRAVETIKGFGGLFGPKTNAVSSKQK